MSTAVTLQGFVGRVISRNESNGWCAFVLENIHANDPVCVGYASVHKNTYVEVKGCWVEHPKYGQQIAVDSAKITTPALSGLARYLRSFVESIGPKTAQDIVDRFGNETLRVIKKQPQQLTSVPNVGEKRAKQLHEAITGAGRKQVTTLKLMRWGFTAKQIARAVKAWGDTSLKRIKANPYELCTLPRFGFTTVDKLALNSGVNPTSQKRLRAACEHFANEETNRGHCWIAKKKLTKIVVTELDVSRKRVIKSLNTCLDSKRLVQAFGTRICPGRLFAAEKSVARAVARLETAKREDPLWSLKANFSECLTFIPTKEQERAPAAAAREPLLIVTGGPGCLHEDTSITDPVDRSTKTVLERYLIGKRFYVYARGPYGPIITIADPPCKYPETAMIEFEFANGETITTTYWHRFWGGTSWIYAFEIYEQLQEYVDVQLPTISGNDLSTHVEDVHHLKKKIQDSLDGYQDPFRFYDGPLRQVSDSAPTSSPSRDGVLERSLLCMRKGGLAFSPSCIDAYIPSSAQSYDPHSRNSYSHRQHNKIGNGPVLQVFSGFCLSSHRSTYRRAQEQYGFQTLQAFGLPEFGRSRGGNRFPPASSSHEVRESDPMSLSFWGACKSPKLPKNLLKRIRIVKANLIGSHPYYDFHVPIYKNYWACGVWNHNTGKTTLIQAVTEAAEQHGLQTALAAPTGRAAQRLKDVCHHDAKTIHRLLEWTPDGFLRNGDNPIEEDLIVVDECFDYKQPILTSGGQLPIGPIVNKRMKVDVFSRDPQTGQLELKPIVGWTKHKAPSRLLKIDVSRSRSKRSARVIRCTGDHKILTPRGYTRARDLHPGDGVIVRGYQLTVQQRSVLIGSLLGDGGLNRCEGRTSPQITVTHGDDQLEYLEFKRGVFGELAGKVCPGKSGYTGKPVWRFGVRIVDELHEIVHEMPVTGSHPSGRMRWSPTDKFLGWVDEQALAVWYMDDGSMNTRVLVDGSPRHYATIHSEGFSKGDNERLAAAVNNRFGLSPKVVPDTRGYHFLRFNKKDSDRLFAILGPFIPGCMGHKIPRAAAYTYESGVQPETSVATVRAIEEVEPRGRFVYDIEVADHHNYVAGNVIVSNCSMLDVRLAASLLRAVKNSASVIFVGDQDQLPPVGCGLVLRDLQWAKVPVVRLEKVHRQALKSYIVRASHRINNADKIKNCVNKVRALGNARKDFEVIIVDKHSHLGTQKSQARVLAKLDYEVGRRVSLGRADVVEDLQVLAPMKKGPLGVLALNERLKNICNPDGEGRLGGHAIGDRVMQTKNDYEKNVFNGQTGKVIWASSEEIVVDFGFMQEVKYDKDDVDNIVTAFACTIHKAQGCEYPVTIVIIHSSHSIMLQRTLLYTAVTRAKDYCIIIADEAGLRRAIENIKPTKRRTSLTKLIREERRKR